MNPTTAQRQAANTAGGGAGPINARNQQQNARNTARRRIRPPPPPQVVVDPPTPAELLRKKRMGMATQVLSRIGLGKLVPLLGAAGPAAAALGGVALLAAAAAASRKAFNVTKTELTPFSAALTGAAARSKVKDELQRMQLAKEHGAKLASMSREGHLRRAFRGFTAEVAVSPLSEDVQSGLELVAQGFEWASWGLGLSNDYGGFTGPITRYMETVGHFRSAFGSLGEGDGDQTIRSALAAGIMASGIPWSRNLADWVAGEDEFKEDSGFKIFETLEFLDVDLPEELTTGWWGWGQNFEAQTPLTYGGA
jgi:hypothetical protein